MREKIQCRRCFENDYARGGAAASFRTRSGAAASISTRGGAAASTHAGGRRPFAITGALPHYAPDLPFRLEHVLLDVKVDPKAKTLEGLAVQRVRTVTPGREWLILDQIGLAIDEVKVAGERAEFQLEGHALRIRLPQKCTQFDQVFEVSVKYHVHDPRRGLYFTGPDKDYPKKPYQVWSQGQDEDSRYWFPSFDYPNQKATSEVIATVPKGFTAVSNGALLSKKDAGESTRFHYKLGTPHVMYLITLTVAEFSEWADQGPNGLPVQYFVHPGREEDGKRAFSNTPAMIAAYAEKTGTPYPYEKYSQVAVQDFIFGGMENTSATTQTDLTLHDARAHLDFSSDPLVSHELAHQWFGDLLTCRDWSHGWLNEGFATFMERVWIEANPGKDGGEDEAKFYSYLDLKEYLEEDTTKYRRPIVCNTYVEPIDLFDAHLYQKGGLVLNLIRHLLGEEPFWKSIRAYVARHRGQNVETLDLIRAIEESTGRNLRRVFDEWVFGAGHPEFELTYAWHDPVTKTGASDGAHGKAEIVIEQKQTAGKPFLEQDGWRTHLFHLPAVVEFTLADGKKVTHQILLGEVRERLFASLPSKPVMVRFDPGNNIPKTIKFPRPKELLLYQLKNDTDCMGRIEAARELILLADRDVVAAMGEAITNDPFWAVQAEVAAALAEVRIDFARDALIAALGQLSKASKSGPQGNPQSNPQGNPKTRRAVVRALGTYKDDLAAAALKAIAEKDESYYVEAEATYAWASAKTSPLPAPTSVVLDEVEGFLLKQLAKPSYREVIRAAALHALSELPGIGRGERPRALAALIEWSKRGHENDIRGAAVNGLGSVARGAAPAERARVFEVLTHLSDEENFRLRLALIGALQKAGGTDASFLLWKINRQDIDGRVKRNAHAAMDAVDAAASTPEAVTQLRTSLEKLEEEYRKLRSLVEEKR